MCYTAIPGTNPGICVIRDLASAVTLPAKSKPEVPIRSVEATWKETIRIASGLREPMRAARLYRDCSRREQLTDYRRGKRLAKRQHKPDWRGYVKY
jgi:hypothetical protein